MGDPSHDFMSPPGFAIDGSQEWGKLTGMEIWVHKYQASNLFRMVESVLQTEVTTQGMTDQYGRLV